MDLPVETVSRISLPSSRPDTFDDRIVDVGDFARPRSTIAEPDTEQIWVDRQLHDGERKRRAAFDDVVEDNPAPSVNGAS
jgi:hypothetical protein